MDNAKKLKEEMIKYLEENEGFIKNNNIHVKSLEENKVELYSEITEKSLNPYDTVHGGLIFGIADTAMGALAYFSRRKAVTVDSYINYLKPCRKNIINCVATTVKVGKTIGSYKAEIYNDKNELSAIVTANYMFLE